MLAGAMAYLNMMAVTTGGQILVDGALAARSLGDAEAEDRAVLAVSSPPTVLLAFRGFCRRSPQGRLTWLRRQPFVVVLTDQRRQAT